MKWSWKLGRFAGIDVYVHATFLLLVGWFAFTYWMQTRTVSGTLEGIGFLLALFASVILHEYGHALTARRYGIRTRDITLLPIGGLARLERMPDKPIQELWVALAGPAVNVVIGVVLFAYLVITGSMESLSSLSLSSGSFAGRLMSVNLSLVLFNLLPAFPMDGGRVVRSLLALRMDYSRATHIAATLGQGMAFLFGLAGLFSNPMLLFIAFFVYIGAAQEASMVQMKTALGGIPVERAMMTNFQILNPRDPLGRATQLILEGYQQDFPVVDDGSVVGVLMRADLLAALSQRGQNVPVADVMKRKFEVVDSSDMLEASLARLQGSDIHTMPVYHNGLLVGMLTTENIGEFLLIQAALGTKKKPQVGYSL